MTGRELREIARALEEWAEMLERLEGIAGPSSERPSSEHSARAAAAERHPAGRAIKANGKVTRQLSNGEVIELVKPYISEPGDYDASEEAYSEADASELGERAAGALWIENDAAPDVDWRRAVIKARANLARHISRTGR